MSRLPDFRLETFFSEWEFKARYHLCASDMQSLALSELLDLAAPERREAWNKLHLGYTETWGSPLLRKTIAATYDRVLADDVLCFAGAEEGIYVAMHALLTGDDHVVVVTPTYQSLETVALSICSVTGVGLDPDDQWSLDLDALERALKPNTRVISINFPHNPTGKVLARAIFDELMALCQERDIYLFSDEVYRLLERDASLRLPQAVDVYERGVSLGVMSKSYGLPGLRIGWIACRDRTLLDRMERVKHYLSICNSAPSELLATIALEARAKILARNRAIVSENLVALGKFMGDYPDLFDWTTPDGGCIGYPRYKGTDGVEAFTRRLVEEAGVLLLPASVYRSELGETPRDRFRVGYGRENMAEALGAFRDFLEGTAGSGGPP
jgi:aspartate/methionine/tyrosine aminotransferase